MLKSEPTTKEESKEPVNAEKISPFDSVSFLENHGLFSQEFATALRGSL